MGKLGHPQRRTRIRAFPHGSLPAKPTYAYMMNEDYSRVGEERTNPKGQRLNEESLLSTLGVFLRERGTTKQVCGLVIRQWPAGTSRKQDYKTDALEYGGCFANWIDKNEKG